MHSAHFGSLRCIQARASAGTSTKVQVATFENPQSFGRVWVNMTDLWNKLGFTFSPGTGPKWFYKRAQRWGKLEARYVWVKERLFWTTRREYWFVGVIEEPNRGSGRAL